MKKILLALLMLSSLPALADTLYFKAGVGYKTKEYLVYSVNDEEFINTKDTAYFELGVRDGNISYGVRHVSNYSRGWPTDSREEYSKDELFIEWQFDLMEF